MTRMGRLLLAAAATLAAGAVAVPFLPGAVDASGGRSMALTIIANPLTIYDQAWDGMMNTRVMLFGLSAGVPLSSPPDLVACVVSAEAINCARASINGRVESVCPDSFRCEFRLPAPRGPFGVVVYDLDDWAPGGMNDLVDAFIVAGRGQDPAAVADLLREAVAALAPTRLQMPEWLGRAGSLGVNTSEERRRAGQVRILLPDACAAMPCGMTQSRVQFGLVP